MALVTHRYRCKDCEREWDETVEREDRDKVRCPDCSGKTLRLISSPYFTKMGQPLNYKEKGIKADLQAANQIEKSMAYGDLKTADSKTLTEANKELTRRKFE
jgi:putative FmdB family regulatory protein